MSKFKGRNPGNGGKTSSERELNLMERWNVGILGVKSRESVGGRSSNLFQVFLPNSPHIVGGQLPFPNLRIAVVGKQHWGNPFRANSRFLDLLVIFSDVLKG
jgi:hypothetical protein